MNWSCSGIMMSHGIIQESLQLATLKDWVFCLLKSQVYPLENRQLRQRPRLVFWILSLGMKQMDNLKW